VCLVYFLFWRSGKLIQYSFFPSIKCRASGAVVCCSAIYSWVPALNRVSSQISFVPGRFQCFSYFLGVFFSVYGYSPNWGEAFWYQKDLTLFSSQRCVLSGLCGNGSFYSCFSVVSSEWFTSLELRLFELCTALSTSRLNSGFQRFQKKFGQVL
jgi:hypothetical protein